MKRGGGLKDLAEYLASKGRHGDSMLVHLHPAELSALEVLTGRKATVNPETGQPEGFAFLVPLIAALVTAGAGIASSKIAADASKDAADMQAKMQQKQQDLDAMRAQQYARDFVNIPIVRNVQSPAPSPRLGLPGMIPEPMLTSQQVSGYLRPGYASGGKVSDPQKVVADAMAALRGAHPKPKQALQAFTEMFGPDELEDLKKMVLGSGGYEGLLQGPGSGMADSIPGSIEGQRPVLLSDGEFVVPAAVVAHLGDG